MDGFPVVSPHAASQPWDLPMTTQPQSSVRRIFDMTDAEVAAEYARLQRLKEEMVEGRHPEEPVPPRLFALARGSLPPLPQRVAYPHDDS